MKKTIVYIMNVDWDWIKQRPHFLAQYLSRLNKIFVLYPRAWRRSHLVKNDRHGIISHPLWQLPFSRKFFFIHKANILLLRFTLRVYLSWVKPDILWFSSPELFECLPARFSGKIIYDCMDDVLAFPSNFSRRELLELNERNLIKRCSMVFCSSQNLRDKLINRAGHPNKYTVVYNAFEPLKFLKSSLNGKKIKNKKKHILGYVGTISSWLDFDSLIELLNLFGSIEIHLIGPIEKSKINFPQHKRIKFLGPIRHKEIADRVIEFDALLMPFHITDLIQSVDPVKLYEYIYLNKPIVSVRYKEIEKFIGFVDFYENKFELFSIINKYLNEGFNKKYSDVDRAKFISSNTWMDRARQIQECLIAMEL